VRILEATLPASSPGLLRQPLSDDDSDVSCQVSQQFFKCLPVGQSNGQRLANQVDLSGIIYSSLFSLVISQTTCI